MSRRISLSVAATVCAIGLAACSGEPEAPTIIDAKSIDGDLSPIDTFTPTPAPPCDMESKAVLDGVKADDFRAWTRTVDGHEETVAVGLWKLDEATAKAQIDRMAEARRACHDSPRGEGYQIDVVSAGGTVEGGLDVWRFEEGAEMVRARHAYGWAQARKSTGNGTYENLDHGYMVTVWLERTDGSKLSSDLDGIMDAQLQQVPGY